MDVQLQCPCANANNDLQLEIQKRCSFLKNVALDFVLLDFEAIPYPSCYLTSSVDKTPHGPVINCSFFCETSEAILAMSQMP